jgi:hypothetical protein
MKATSVKPIRCAIYTRVSTDQGLDQEFNSLDAQYDASSAYIKSQAHAGWTLIKARYDDGGYSGGSTDRPDLQRLLDDVRARKIDVIVVYKVDRPPPGTVLVRKWDRKSICSALVTDPEIISSSQRLPRAMALTSRRRRSGRSGRTSFRDEPWGNRICRNLLLTPLSSR